MDFSSISEYDDSENKWEFNIETRNYNIGEFGYFTLVNDQWIQYL
jgi:hypothetical protein